jgi:hypothetical protein
MFWDEHIIRYKTDHVLVAKHYTLYVKGNAKLNNGDNRNNRKWLKIGPVA